MSLLPSIQNGDCTRGGGSQDVLGMVELVSCCFPEQWGLGRQVSVRQELCLHPKWGLWGGNATLSDSCLASKCCQPPAPCRAGLLPRAGRASCQAAAAARGRGPLFIREIRQLMRDGPQSSCSSAAAGTDAGEAEVGGEGKAHFVIKNDGTAEG